MTPGYTPNPTINHEYGQSAHITGHRLIIDLAGPECLHVSDIEDRLDQLKETFGEMGCVIERVRLVEQRDGP